MKNGFPNNLKPKDNEGTITIDRDLYADLVAESELLQALFAAGVDNWEGYTSALRTVEE